MFIDWKSAVLGALVIPLVPICLLIWQRGVERRANLLLIGLLGAWAMLSVPFIIGFMGAYQAFPWLTFAPFNTELWFGPLIYLYTVALTSGRLPAHWRRWLAPGIIQSTYYTICFVALGPAERKFAFNDAFHEPVIVPLETVIGLGLAIAGIAKSWRQISAYQSWLADTHGNKAQYSLQALRLFLILITGLFLVWLVTDIIQAVVGKFSYPTLGLYYITIGAGFFLLALDRLSQVALAYPKQQSLDVTPPPAPMPELAAPPKGPSVTEIAEKIRTGQWHHDPQLTISALARHLGTNSSTLSAIINGAEGLNFNALVNRLRVEEVCRALLAPDETRSLYEIALDHGFGSKATFNRVFKDMVGMTPTQFRKAQDASQIPDFWADLRK